MTMLSVTLYRCSECNRLYEDKPEHCVCARKVYVKGERFGPFIIEGESNQKGYVRVRCILCDTFCDVAYNNIKKQHSCGCKAYSADILELDVEFVVYRCRRCDEVTTARLPIVEYCCEGEDAE